MALMLPKLLKDWFDYSLFQAGLRAAGFSIAATLCLVAVPVILGSVLRIPMGMLTDRFGGRRMFTLMLAFAVLPAVLFGYADGSWQLIGVAFLLGVSGSSFAIGIPFVSGWFTHHRQGVALGVYGMGNIGTAVAALSAPAIVNNWGRPALGWITGGILAATACLFAVGARDAPRQAPPAHYLDVIKAGWRLYRLAFFYFITFGGFVAMALMLPKLLKDWFDYSLFQAGLRAAGFSIAATLARPVGGWLADRFGAYPILTLAFAGIAADAAVLAALAPSPRIIPITITCLTLASFLGVGNGAVFKLVPLEFPHDAGAAAGIVGAAGGLGGFFPPIAMGLIKDQVGTYTLGFVGLLAATGLCLALAVWLIRSAVGVELRGVGVERASG
jgi:NNP family nitrate/nitrite transporter-like MFS transporter